MAASPESVTTCRIYVGGLVRPARRHGALDGILDALRDIHLLQLAQPKSAQRYGDWRVLQSRK